MNLSKNLYVDKKLFPIFPMNENTDLDKKNKKILVYNGFSFHYEMIGFILDFSNKYNIDITRVNKIMNYEWFELYIKKYKFKYLNILPSIEELNDYLIILLLTDCDMSFPNSLINNKTVCIDHYYKNIRPEINYHIPIIPFNENISNYALPIFEYIDYKTKIKILSKNKRPIITFVGDSTISDNISSLSIINNLHEFDIYIINRRIRNKNIKLPNIYFFENIPATKMFELFISSNYICFISNDSIKAMLHYNCQSMTAAMPISFSTGCKLIIPKNMNKYLKLNSIVEYSPETPFSLDKNPSLLKTFEERNRLLSIRDNSIFTIILSENLLIDK